MKSARRRALISRKKKENRVNIPFLKFLIPLVLISGIFIFVRASTRVWNGQDKVAVAFKKDNGDVGVTVMDPKLDEITTLIIPGGTQVDVARNYGTMRIKNVWQLGVNEKIGGSLLPETVTQNFFFPVLLWGSSETANLISGNIAGVLRFVFMPGSTNVSFGDRLSMGIFALKTQDLGRNTIDLGKSLFLDKQILNDGQPGYVISGPISQRLTVYFSDNEIGDKDVRVNIVDATGKPGVSEKVGGILQVLGGKVVSVDKKIQPEDSDCLIYGSDPKILKKISDLFSCQVGKGSTSFDLEIHLGQKFAKRF